MTVTTLLVTVIIILTIILAIIIKISIKNQKQTNDIMILEITTKL